jgi:hypothetical protein
MFDLRSERYGWGGAHAESKTQMTAPMEEVHLAIFVGTWKGS